MSLGDDLAPLEEAESGQAPERAGTRVDRHWTAAFCIQLHARRRTPQTQDWLPYLFAGSGLVPYKTCHKEGPESDGVTWVAVPSCTERRIDGIGVFQQLSSPMTNSNSYPASMLILSSTQNAQPSSISGNSIYPSKSNLIP